MRKSLEGCKVITPKNSNNSISYAGHQNINYLTTGYYKNRTTQQWHFTSLLDDHFMITSGADATGMSFNIETSNAVGCGLIESAENVESPGNER